eukprot:TRINITY_DN3214_c0_g1_i1.p1 TRINITY_DN3214_c0_g1~~TRINITY_DN3214_c0_g1_i1.p1  ORF type:complete len:339 (-),score=68.72 TRINITY_DN3214_c0_g1_i1:3-1019(-)
MAQSAQELFRERKRLRQQQQQTADPTDNILEKHKRSRIEAKAQLMEHVAPRGVQQGPAKADVPAGFFDEDAPRRKPGSRSTPPPPEPSVVKAQKAPKATQPATVPAQVQAGSGPASGPRRAVTAPVQPASLEIGFYDDFKKDAKARGETGAQRQERLKREMELLHQEIDKAQTEIQDNFQAEVQEWTMKREMEEAYRLAEQYRRLEEIRQARSSIPAERSALSENENPAEELSDGASDSEDIEKEVMGGIFHWKTKMVTTTSRPKPPSASSGNKAPDEEDEDDATETTAPTVTIATPLPQFVLPVAVESYDTPTSDTADRTADVLRGKWRADHVELLV